MGALTLAARTRVPMGDRALRVGEGRGDGAEYAEECGVVEGVMQAVFYKELARGSGFRDGSPDLVRWFDGVIDEIRLKGLPRARWLCWSTGTGSLLFSLLVAVKMRRFLLEEKRGIVQTEAWRAWEEGCRRLQRRVFQHVRME
jgi:hypothetical protein